MRAILILRILIGLCWILSGSDAQAISTSCSSSMISSFSPCLSFITGSGSSSGGGGSPTRICCDAVKSLMLNNMDCACLIITGNVPVSIPFLNANLGSALPKACKTSIPLQCKSSGVPLPAPGPVLFAPPPPPAPIPVHVPAPAPAPVHAHSPKGSKAATTAASPEVGRSDIAPNFPLGPSANPGIRPVMNPKSSASTLFTVSLPYIALIVAGLIAFKF